jgi:PqqD family protein of HPr-rel-A system
MDAITSPPAVLRRLGDDGALFDPVTWQTHILNPAALLLVELIQQEFRGHAPRIQELQEVVRSELGWNVESPDLAQTLLLLVECRLARA